MMQRALLAASLLTAAVACGGADFEQAPPLAKLEGPWPAQVEGHFEIADISDAGGEDYLAAGWIETSDGDVMVHALGAVLEQGGVPEGGRVRASVRPAEAVADQFEIVEIRRLD